MTTVTIPDAAQRLGLSERTVYSRARSGTLQATKVKGRWMVELPDGDAQTVTVHQEQPRQRPQPTRAELAEIAYANPLHLFKGQIQAYNPSLLVTRKGLAIFEDIRRDDQAKAALAFKKHAVLASGWEIVSPEDQADDWDVRRFVEEQFIRIPGTFNDVLLGILTALDFGHSASEKIFERIEGGEWNGKIGLRAVKERAVKSIQYDVDEHGNIKPDGVLQLFRDDVGMSRMPRAKFIVFQHQSEFDNPYGTSDLEAAYRSHWVKDQAHKWLAMLLERYGIPPMFGLYDPDAFTPGQIDDLKTIFERMQAATSGLIPRAQGKESLELWSPELAGQVSRVFIPAFEMLDRGIARSILMPGMLSLTPDQTGSFARAKVAFDVFVLIVEYIRQALEEKINEELVEDLVTLNFSTDDRPEFRFLPISEDTQIDLLKAWAELLGVGAVTSGIEDEKHIRSLVKFPEKEDADEPPPGMPPEDVDDDGEDDDEGPPVPTDEEIEEAQQTFAAVQRAMVEAERQADFARIEREADEVEEKAKGKLVTGFREITDDVVRKINEKRGGLSLAFVDRLEVEFPRSLNRSFEEMMLEGFRRGRAQVSDQLGQRRDMQGEPSYEPTAAIRWLRDQAKFWVRNTGAELTKNIKQELAAALKFGLHTREAIQRVREIMAPWTGDPAQLGDPAQASAARVETIIRTNNTNAFNQGRLIEARNLGARLVPAMFYSSIIDASTTEVCRFLDGKVFRADDPALSRLSPSNHFRCRAVLVPMTVDLVNDETRFITAGQIGRAIELAGRGFA